MWYSVSAWCCETICFQHIQNENHYTKKQNGYWEERTSTLISTVFNWKIIVENKKLPNVKNGPDGGFLCKADKESVEWDDGVFICLLGQSCRPNLKEKWDAMWHTFTNYSSPFAYSYSFTVLAALYTNSPSPNRPFPPLKSLRELPRNAQEWAYGRSWLTESSAWTWTKLKFHCHNICLL